MAPRSLTTVMSMLAASVALFFGTLLTSAHAYLDPGTGGVVLQVIVAAIAGGLLAVKAYWERVVSFFRPAVSSDPSVEKASSGESSGKKEH
jgi:hypothetical protein